MTYVYKTEKDFTDKTKTQEEFLTELIESAQEASRKAGMIGIVGSLAWNMQMQQLVSRIIIENIAIDFHIRMHREEGTDMPKIFGEWWKENEHKYK